MLVQQVAVFHSASCSGFLLGERSSALGLYFLYLFIEDKEETRASLWMVLLKNFFFLKFFLNFYICCVPTLCWALWSPCLCALCPPFAVTCPSPVRKVTERLIQAELQRV